MGKRSLIIIIAIILLVLSGLYYKGFPRSARAPSSPTVPASQNPAAISTAVSTLNQLPAGFALPMADAQSRVTKKPFDIFVSPGNSPVSPEKFTGYHTGTDFETTPAEQNIDVSIYAVCDGKLLVKRLASGYGGVVVQTCKYQGKDITVVYGHLRLTSIGAKVGDPIKAGDQLAVLGTGYSTETDGERKHLHLGIHKGSAVNFAGYVPVKAELSAWIDPQLILG